MYNAKMSHQPPNVGGLNDRVPAFDIDSGVEQQEHWAF